MVSPGDTWHLDECFITIQGRHQCWCRVVDDDIGAPVVRVFRDVAEEAGLSPLPSEH